MWAKEKGQSRYSGIDLNFLSSGVAVPVSRRRPVVVHLGDELASPRLHPLEHGEGHGLGLLEGVIQRRGHQHEVTSGGVTTRWWGEISITHHFI